MALWAVGLYRLLVNKLIDSSLPLLCGIADGVHHHVVLLKLCWPILLHHGALQQLANVQSLISAQAQLVVSQIPVARVTASQRFDKARPYDSRCNDGSAHPTQGTSRLRSFTSPSTYRDAQEIPPQSATFGQHAEDLGSLQLLLC